MKKTPLQSSAQVQVWRSGASSSHLAVWGQRIRDTCHSVETLAGFCFPNLPALGDGLRSGPKLDMVLTQL